MSKPKITQQIIYRESLIKYTDKHSVTKASRVYNVNGQYIYRWIKRYDGTTCSLGNLSKKPKCHPNQHTPEELKLIKNMFDNGVTFWHNPNTFLDYSQNNDII